jgi:predicted ATP-grasp superfamily ATP-dependent carboligase
VVRTSPEDIAHLSRHASSRDDALELGRRPETLVDLLEGRARDWSGWALFPTNDDALEVLGRNHERLSGAYRLTIPPWEIVRRVLDKELTYEAAREVGVETPACYGPASLADLGEREYAYPVLVKPSESHVFYRHFRRKLFLARGPAELRSAVEQVEAAGIRCQLFDYVPGSDGDVWEHQLYMDERGEPAGEFTVRKLRQSPPFFGTSRAARPGDATALHEPSVELLRRLEWRGIAEVTYKLDRRMDRFVLIEVNGRSFLTNNLAWRAGINYGMQAYGEHVLGERRTGIEPNGWQGTWLHLHADLLYTLRWYRQERLPWREFRRSYAGPKTYAVWSRRDPRPFLAEWGHTVRKAARMAIRPEEREEIAGRVQWPSLPGEDQAG